MRKIALPLLFLALAASASAQTCYSPTNHDSNGNPCTNIVTAGGIAYNGAPTSLPLKSQDGVASPNSQGLYNVGYIDLSNLQTNLPQDPLATLGYNVVSPWHSPPNALQLESGNVHSLTSTGTSGGLVQGSSITITHYPNQVVSFAYVFSPNPLAQPASVTITGCSQRVCSQTLDLYTGTTNITRNISSTAAAPFDSFLIYVGALDPTASLLINAPCGVNAQFTVSDLYVFDSGNETIDPPDANGNNVYDWGGSATVPLTFHHCISSGGRGSRPSPVYITGDGTGELSAVGSFVQNPPQ